jgi:hypothetical protein
MEYIKTVRRRETAEYKTFSLTRNTKVTVQTTSPSLPVLTMIG